MLATASGGDILVGTRNDVVENLACLLPSAAEVYAVAPFLHVLAYVVGLPHGLCLLRGEQFAERLGPVERGGGVGEGEHGLAEGYRIKPFGGTVGRQEYAAEPAGEIYVLRHKLAP